MPLPRGDSLEDINSITEQSSATLEETNASIEGIASSAQSAARTASDGAKEGAEGAGHAVEKVSAVNEDIWKAAESIAKEAHLFPQNNKRGEGTVHAEEARKVSSPSLFSNEMQYYESVAGTRFLEYTTSRPESAPSSETAASTLSYRGYSGQYKRDYVFFACKMHNICKL